jgi:hypothetical protein
MRLVLEYLVGCLLCDIPPCAVVACSALCMYCMYCLECGSSREHTAVNLCWKMVCKLQAADGTMGYVEHVNAALRTLFALMLCGALRRCCPVANFCNPWTVLLSSQRLFYACCKLLL